MDPERDALINGLQLPPNERQDIAAIADAMTTKK
jgi:hypothetical protein